MRNDVWNIRWSKVKELKGGGQSSRYLVKDSSAAMPQNCFLKTPFNSAPPKVQTLKLGL